MATRYDTIGRLRRATRTDQGFAVAPARFTRTGVLTYHMGGKVVRELRHPDEVFSPESLATAGAGLPVTIGHVPAVTPETVAAKVGQTVSAARKDGRYLAADVQVEARHALDRVDAGELVELSAGYRCDIDPTPGVWQGERYDQRQTNIRYNHIALLPAGGGRAGADVALRLDAADDLGYTMGMQTITINGVTFEVADEVAAELTAQTARADAADAKVKLEAERADAAEGKAKAEAQRADGIDIEGAVKARLELVDAVRTMVPDFKYAGQTVEQMHRAALDARKVRHDGKDAAWCAVAFEVLPQAVPVAALPVTQSEPERRADSAPSLEQIRNESIARKANQWRAK